MLRLINQSRGDHNKNHRSIMQAPYIPSKDSLFALWLQNFAVLIAATPTDYGLVTGDATIITASNVDFQAKYALASNPTTRTSGTIADKDTARTSATATCQPYAQLISRNMGIDDSLKLGVGVNLPNPTRTIIPAPTTTCVLAHISSQPGVAQIGYADTSTPTTKAKPFGAIGLDLRQTIGTAPAVSPDDAKPVQTVTKSPTILSFSSGDVGKIVTIWGRWVTRGGPAGVAQQGPWSAPLSFAIM